MCVATISDMVDNRLLIHFDNWDETYDYWYRESFSIICLQALLQFISLSH